MLTTIWKNSNDNIYNNELFILHDYDIKNNFYFIIKHDAIVDTFELYKCIDKINLRIGGCDIIKCDGISLFVFNQLHNKIKNNMNYIISILNDEIFLYRLQYNEVKINFNINKKYIDDINKKIKIKCCHILDKYFPNSISNIIVNYVDVKPDISMHCTSHNIMDIKVRYDDTLKLVSYCTHTTYKFKINDNLTFLTSQNTYQIAMFITDENDNIYNNHPMHSIQLIDNDIIDYGVHKPEYYYIYDKYMNGLNIPNLLIYTITLKSFNTHTIYKNNNYTKSTIKIQYKDYISKKSNVYIVLFDKVFFAYMSGIIGIIN